MGGEGRRLAIFALTSRFPLLFPIIIPKTLSFEVVFLILVQMLYIAKKTIDI